MLADLRRTVGRWLEADKGRWRWGVDLDVVRPLVLPRGVSVIGVGGATLGGSGRTPLAIAVARALFERGVSVAMVGHAYGGKVDRACVVSPDDDVARVGDEALICARALGPRVPVIVAPTRQIAVDFASTRARVVVVDRLLQTRPTRLALSLLAVDERAPWGAGARLPFGDLVATRDVLLGAADEVVAIGSDRARHTLSFDLDGFDGDVKGMRVGLVTSAARPHRIVRALAERGVVAVVHVERADHAPMHRRERFALAELGRRHRLDTWLLDEKTRAHGGEGVTIRHWLTLSDALIDRIADSIGAPMTTRTVAEIRALHDLPLLELLHRAQGVHREHHPKNQVQLCTLLSVKTGACPEDCAYCPQSSRYETKVEPERLMDVDDVLTCAQRAKDAGATRFCMGAAWREAKDGPQFDRVLAMVKGVKGLGLETCATLGMVTPDQAQRLKQAGLDTYNHNIDTSREYYKKIITTRSYEERLSTLQAVRDAGIHVCCGGIIGMGESIDDRCRMLHELASQSPHPESVPINALVPVEGTPLAGRAPIDPLELVRMIATARILMPRARVRLSAGRQELGREAQILCLMAGANSIFYGEQLLTTPNPDTSFDRQLLADVGLTPLAPDVA